MVLVYCFYSREHVRMKQEWCLVAHALVLGETLLLVTADGTNVKTMILPINLR